MPSTEEFSSSHSEEVNEIITAVPSWILRRGILVILTVLVSIVILSALIQYPDIVRTTLKISLLNSPKSAIAHQPGKLVKILASENQQVVVGQPLAYIESTGSHNQVISLAKILTGLRSKIDRGENIDANDLAKNLNLGELQGSYQAFYQQYLLFLNTQKGGLFMIQKQFLVKEMSEVQKLRSQIYQQEKIQQQEYQNAEEEYEAYKKLKSKNVISNSEFKQQESKFLSSKYPLQQTTTALLNNNSTLTAKQKELVELENTVKEEQAKFIQALNSMINDTDMWLTKYVIFSPIDGKVSYAGLLQENQNVTLNQELFIVDPGNTAFFGEANIPQYNLGKVGIGQKVLIKLRSYPFEEYGMIKGKVSYISDFALRDSIFVAKIDFKKAGANGLDKEVVLKQGMMGDAEIVTKESSLLQRFARSITKIFNNER